MKGSLRSGFFAISVIMLTDVTGVIILLRRDREIERRRGRKGRLTD